MKIRPICLPLVVVSIVSLLAILPGAALAQDPNLDGSSPSNPTQAAPGAAPGVIGPEQPMGSGSTRSNTWIAATKFTGKQPSSLDLVYAGQHFYTSTGSTSAQMYFAPLELEQGLLVDMISCAFNDGSTTNDLSFDLQKVTMDLAGHTASWTSLGTGSSSGNPGISFVNIPLTANETIQNQAANTVYQYVIRADVSSDVSFAGCLVYWKRQVSPAPASATFTDVPTSHPFFKFIEALYSSGITAGCSPTEYCPDQPLTRGEMAVFLAAGLGLNYPF
ncbi:MAG: S-layer homology domain-containing protein [Thermoanaerobaculia bacterium]|mgnify:CR=1 FL=1|jgi:hypothetical protein|nr:S-layer homology domain-containing protein [Thermoanaerobaculia bacterium]